MSARNACVGAFAALLLAACASSGRPATLDQIHAQDAEEQRAVGALKTLYTLEMTYQAQYGRFAPGIDELKDIGWKDVDTGRFRPAVTDAGSRLCLAMLPTSGPRVAWSISGQGVLYRGPRCGR